MGYKGVSPLHKLPQHERILNTPVDPMHLIKNVGSHIVNLISGHEDSVKVRQQEKHLGRFKNLWDITLADERARRVSVPYGFDWRPRGIYLVPRVEAGCHKWNPEVLLAGNARVATADNSLNFSVF